MTHREQKEAIAEFDGWTPKWVDNRSDPNPNAAVGWWTEMPDYPNDLNALHGVVQKLDSAQYWKFIRELFKITEEWPNPRQVSEALLKTIGKWKE